MRNGITIIGVVLLILGFVGLVIGILAYSRYEYLINLYGGLALLSRRVYDRARFDRLIGIAGIISGGILLILGIVLTVLGFKSKKGRRRHNS